MKFLFNVKSEILRQYTRFVDGHRIRLFVVRDTFSFLGGFISFENRDVVVNWDPSKVKKEEEYRVYMAVKAFEYTVRSNDSELLIGVQ